MKFYKLLLFCLFFVGLILLQREYINPFAVDIVTSDLFLADTEDVGNPNATSTVMTDHAHMFCNRYITDEIDPDLKFVFSDKPIHAWSLGGYVYLINSELEIINNDGKSSMNKYVCRINYDSNGGDEGTSNYENWSVYGLSGLEELIN